MNRKSEKIVLIGNPGSDFSCFDQFFLTENSFRDLHQYIQKISNTRKKKLYGLNNYSPLLEESLPNLGLSYQKENLSYAYSYFCKLIEICPNQVSFFFSNLDSENQVLNNTVNAFINGYLLSLKLAKSDLLIDQENLIEQITKDISQFNAQRSLEIIYGIIDLSSNRLEYTSYKSDKNQEWSRKPILEFTTKNKKQRARFSKDLLKIQELNSIELGICDSNQEKNKEILISLNLNPQSRKEYTLTVGDKNSYQILLEQIKTTSPQSQKTNKKKSDYIQDIDLRSSFKEIFDLLEFQKKRKVKITWWEKDEQTRKLDLVLESSTKTNPNLSFFDLSNYENSVLNYLLLFFEYFKVSKDGNKLSLRKDLSHS